MKVLTLSLLLVSLCNRASFALKLPGPLVYVVTPSSNPRSDEGRSAPQPFYYHNWMRRMDSPSNTTTATKAPPVKTPDLIFAEFESDNMKNIRKLLEKEKIERKTTTTTSKPIYVPDEEIQDPQNVNYESPPVPQKEVVDPNKKDMTDYFALYNNLYNVDNAPPDPIYLPSTKAPTPRTTPSTTTTTTTTTTPAPVNNVENIWHIIDNQKQDQYSGQWDEVPLGPEEQQQDTIQDNGEKAVQDTTGDDGKIDDNFALPGFSTDPRIGGENESRAIRTEPNMRFPYVNLKPFQMKNTKKPFDIYSNSKKGNNMYTNLDNFVEVKHPVRGEIQDIVPMRQPIDRYNPAQPYLPSPNEYGSKSKQSSPSSAPTKTYANLVPPPPPPPPKISDGDFPAPSTYEQFPPFAPSDSDAGPPSPPAKSPMSPPSMESDDNSGMMDLGYRYKPPSPPMQNFVPTIPPLQKPSGGYSYNKPPMTVEAPPTDDDDKPDFQGYNYDKPAPVPDQPSFPGYHYDKPAPVPDKPSFHGYHYSKPEHPAPPKDHGPSYGPDYPDLVFDKHHGNSDDTKGGDDAKANDMNADDMGMAPPPMPDMKPGPDDSGFPHDFPGDFKYGHFDDDHDFYHHHHHHPTTTTTTTTEMPRVNRYSYYYLGKKLYYLPLYFSVYFIVYVAALIIKAVLRHKIVYPNSWRPNDQTAGFFSKRSVDSWDLSNENLHEVTGRVTHAITSAAKRYMDSKKEE